VNHRRRCRRLNSKYTELCVPNFGRSSLKPNQTSLRICSFVSGCWRLIFRSPLKAFKDDRRLMCIWPPKVLEVVFPCVTLSPDRVPLMGPQMRCRPSTYTTSSALLPVTAVKERCCRSPEVCRVFHPKSLIEHSSFISKCGFFHLSV
jgi:hypothetical protein